MLKIEKPPYKRTIICTDPWGAGCGLGDTWWTCSYLLELASKNKDALIVAQMPKMYARFQQIKDMFAIDRTFYFNNWLPKLPLSHLAISWGMLDNHRQLPVKQVWKSNQNKVLCYQFDGHWDAELKNPPPLDIKWFLSSCQKMGYETIDIGHLKPFWFIDQSILRSAFFVGIPSGLTHVCISYRIPILLATYRYSSEFVRLMRANRFRMVDSISWFINLQEIFNNLRVTKLL
jgi:hypothetical protein